MYLLRQVLDHPKFEGLACSEPSLLGRDGSITNDFFPPDDRGFNSDIEPLTPVWKAPKCHGRVMAYNDFPCVNFLVPAFSERAVDCLKEFLEPNGELLPLEHPAGKFFAFNCLRVVDILDQDKSNVEWFSSTGPHKFALDIRHFVVDEDRLKSLSVFRLREQCTSIFITEAFLTAIQSHGLNGFDCPKVVPFPTDVYWRDAHKEACKSVFAKGDSHSDAGVKAESLLIELTWETSKLSDLEKKALKTIQDDLDAQLMVTKLSDPYFGSLEGRRSRKGKSVLYLSCPSSARLFDKLQDYLRALPWHSPPQVILRDVPFDDSRSVGTTVKL